MRISIIIGFSLILMLASLYLMLSHKRSSLAPEEFFMRLELENGDSDIIKKSYTLDGRVFGVLSFKSRFDLEKFISNNELHKTEMTAAGSNFEYETWHENDELINVKEYVVLLDDKGRYYSVYYGFSQDKKWVMYISGDE